MRIARLNRPLGIVAAVVLVAVVSHPAFAAKIYPYAEVSTNIAAECFPTTSLGLGDYAYDSVAPVAGKAQSDYESDGWPTAVGVPMGSSGGHLWLGRANAELDLAAGTIRASAASVFTLDNSEWLLPTQPSEGAGFSKIYANIVVRDTITLSEPATITFTGHADGKLRALNSHPNDQDDPYVGAAVSVSFTSDLPIPGDPDGMHETYGSLRHRYDAPVTHGGIAIVPGDWPIYPFLDINDPLTLSVDLPAGTSRVDLSFGVWIEMNLEMNPPVWSTQSAETDFGNTLHFQFIVPEGVEATSGSGLLPLVVPEPASLTMLGLGALALISRRRD
ncbi:MAG: PEP-CTERM sorting domain-containing protein [Phycisphaeraceae bacterium]|nr:PEP-CTERM sorting domain-containing protein [Phycisphaeraceae bacterium]